jgi:hypothetical protein
MLYSRVTNGLPTMTSNNESRQLDDILNAKLLGF